MEVVVHVTAKQVISGRCSSENDCEVYRNEIILIYQFIIFSLKKLGLLIRFRAGTEANPCKLSQVSEDIGQEK